ncbi:MAG: hypothetical protein ACYCPW_06750 [Nitrososphaerales archaeon]
MLCLFEGIGKEKSVHYRRGILAIIGGILILQSGVATRSFLVTAISYSDQKFGGTLPGIAQSTIQIALLVLSSIISLGGLVAIVGGVLVLLKHRLIGKILIALGGGLGFLGIAISMGYDVFTTGVSVILTHFQYWIGVLIATIGRYLV